MEKTAYPIKEFFSKGGHLASPWDNLSIREKAEMMKVAVRNGITNLSDIKQKYNEFAEGGEIESPVENSNIYAGGSYLDIAKQHIKKNEGWLAKPYRDAPKGKNWRSVGYGFNDSGFRNKYPQGISKYYENGITKAEAEKELNWFLGGVVNHLKKVYGRKWDSFNDNQKAAIIDTYYQRPASVVGKGSQFYRAVMAGDKNAGNYLGVAGYGNRNKDRRKLFGASQIERVAPTQEVLPISDPIQNVPEETVDFIPWNPQAFFGVNNNTPIIIQQEAPVVEERMPTPEEIERQERQQGLANFQTIMGMLNNTSDNTSTTMTPFESTVSMLTQQSPIHYFSDGGSISIKPENRGKFTRLKERTGHPEGDNNGPKFKESQEAYYDKDTDTIYAPDSTGEFYHHEMFHARPNSIELERLKPYYENLDDNRLLELGADLPFIKRIDNDPGHFYSPEEVGARVSAAKYMLNNAGINKVDNIFLEEARKNENAYGNNFRDLLHMYNDDNLIGIFNNSYSSGGKIYIKPSHRGRFTALKERTGHSASWFKENGTPAQKKMATFALNARHWKHGLGGNLFEFGGDGGNENITPWKALDNIDYKAIPDTTFTKDKTGTGSIEYFNSLYPEGITYPNGYHREHPLPGKDVILYNPNDNDEQDIRLDALHIMPKDATYDVLNTLYREAAKDGDVAYNAKRRYEEDLNKYGKENIDSYTQYFNNEADGLLRNMLIEGTPEYIESKRYYPNKRKLREWNRPLLPYIDNIQKYLETGERPTNILPEVAVYGRRRNKRALGGNLFEDGGTKAGIPVDYLDPLEVMPLVANNPNKSIVLDEVVVTPFKKLPMQSDLFEGITNQAANEKADEFANRTSLTPERFIGLTAASVPLAAGALGAVVAAPVVGNALMGSVINPVSDYIGGTAVGQMITRGLSNPYVSKGIEAAFAGHGLNHAINEGIDGYGDAALTALELAPLGGLAKPMMNAGRNSLGLLKDNAKAFYNNLTMDLNSVPGSFYHGSPSRTIEEFIPGKDGGIYFTPTKRAARGYTGNLGTGRVYEANLNLGDNPVVVDARGKAWNSIPEEEAAKAFGIPKEEIYKQIGHYNAGAEPWYSDFLKPFGYNPNTRSYAVDQLVALGKDLGKSSLTIKGAKDSGKGLFGWRQLPYDQTIVYRPEQVSLLKSAPQITAENAANYPSIMADADDFSYKGLSSIKSDMEKIIYNNKIHGKPMYPSDEGITGFSKNVQTGVPKTEYNELLHDVIGRNVREFKRAGLNDAQVSDYINNAKNAMDNVHIGMYSNSDYIKGGWGGFGGFYDSEGNFISVNTGSPLSKTKVVKHEGRHLLDHKVDDEILMPTSESFGNDFDSDVVLSTMQKVKQNQNMILYDAYDNDFITLPNKKGFNDGLEGYSNMGREAITTNLDSRNTLLGSKADWDFDTTDKIIDKMPDAAIFEAVEKANGYGKRFIKFLRENNKLTPKKAQQFREAMKHVGAYIAPTISIGAGAAAAAEE